MHRMVGKVIAIDLSFMRISSNEFSLCGLRLKHTLTNCGKVRRTFAALTTWSFAHLDVKNNSVMAIEVEKLEPAERK